MTRPRAVGIDLGTTYSTLATIDETGKSSIVRNQEGELLTPSAVLFDDDLVLVGREAKKVGVYSADRFADCAKRDMGAASYSKAIGGRRLPPEVIQAFILKKLGGDVKAAVGGEVKAVITVPAFFDEPRRKATVDAARMAGVSVLDIVNEPTAAALAYSEQEGYLRQGAAPKEKKYVLVYDLGGGTFDVTLIEMQAGNIRMVATDGDVRLGGRDWDEVLADLAAMEFEKKFKVDPRNDRVAFQKLVAAAEEAKHTLTLRANSSLSVSEFGHSFEFKISRDRFEEETAHLLERTAYVARQVLTAAGLDWKDVSKILLVGGSSRMPMVSKMLKERTGIEPDHSVNPDEAVARGAAIYCDYLLDLDSPRPRHHFKITNVNSHSLGIEGVDPRTGRKCNNIIIPRNSPLPIKKTERFATKSKGQKSVVVKVLEGESPVPTECTPIGKTAIRDLPPDLAAGTPIFVTYEYGTNGRVSVRARVEGVAREVRLELERDGALSESLVAGWAALVQAGSGMASFQAILGTMGLDNLPNPAKPASAGASGMLPSPKAAGLAGAAPMGHPASRTGPAAGGPQTPPPPPGGAILHPPGMAPAAPGGIAPSPHLVHPPAARSVPQPAGGYPPNLMNQPVPGATVPYVPGNSGGFPHSAPGQSVVHYPTASPGSVSSASAPASARPRRVSTLVWVVIGLAAAIVGMAVALKLRG